ncbi:MAG: sulfotransferase family protein [Gammaproteobacteria bacterium]|nr:sulfotransferase family protein [Gammaproteobacteria bacterium]
MIFHKHRLIFIHIPKCAGSSIGSFYSEGKKFNWEEPDYEYLYGWCPKRQIHLQHATAKQLLDTDLITEDIWNSYHKFTIIRNPWDRSYSDYMWIMKDRNIRGSFKEYITKSGSFTEPLQNKHSKNYRGDHLIPQSDFFATEGKYAVDYVFRFENLLESIKTINSCIQLEKDFSIHEKRNKKRLGHYSLFYTNSKKRLVNRFFGVDIEKFGYQFEDQKKGLMKVKNFF